MKTVIDSGILMNTNLLPSIDGEVYLPSSVKNEIQSRLALNIYELFSSQQKITIMDPDRHFLTQIDEIATELGQRGLSTTDKEVLALALQLTQLDEEVVLYSDDYGVRNIAHHLELPSQGITTQGGHQKRSYGYLCLACGARYSNTITECDTCGHTEFRRYRRS
jgi:rRNA maturation endonuclease Nob1